MFLKSSGLVFLAISLCVQARPASQPCHDDNGNNNGSSTATRATTATSSAASLSATGVQTSLTLDSNVICQGFANDGQSESAPNPGQIASLTSTNNFINFCLDFPDTNLTNGKQLSNGSCNPAPMGRIPPSDKMPSSKFISPQNLGTVKANQNFTIKMAINNVETGKFVNPEASYFAAPQQLNSQGLIIGHSHFVIQLMSSFEDPKPLDPKKFAFFTAANSAAVKGVLSATVNGGLPAGNYKLSSITTAANHQPVLVPIAQHGSLDDAIYFSVTADGKANSTSITPSTNSAAC